MGSLQVANLLNTFNQIQVMVHVFLYLGWFI